MTDEAGLCKTTFVKWVELRPAYTTSLNLDLNRD